MIMPSDVDLETISEEQLIVKLIKVGYGKDAARYISQKLLGVVVDDNQLM